MLTFFEDSGESVEILLLNSVQIFFLKIWKTVNISALNSVKTFSFWSSPTEIFADASACRNTHLHLSSMGQKWFCHS